MKILTIHNKHLISGGEEQSHASEMNLLANKGHIVHEFVIDNKQIKRLGKFRAGLQAIWSTESYNHVESLVKNNKYDLILIQNFFPLLSPSIFYPLKKYKVPNIFFVRNYRLSCLNGLFLRNNRVCEDCLGKIFPWPGVLHRCYQSSTPGSMSVATMLVVHNLLNTWNRTVDAFITLTNFSKSKLIKSGIPEAKVFVRPNFLDHDPNMGLGSRDGFLFVGRLSEEKGIDTLLNCWENLSSLKLTIIGNGPKYDQVMQISNFSLKIKALGRRSQEQIFDHLKSSIALIMPSTFYETFGRTIIEAFATGTPVIASNHGAMAEIIQDGKTGLLFTPGDSADLAVKVRWASEHPAEMAEMGNNARAEFEAKYTADKAYDSLMDIYEQITK